MFENMLQEFEKNDCGGSFSKPGSTKVRSFKSKYMIKVFKGFLQFSLIVTVLGNLECFKGKPQEMLKKTNQIVYW